METGSERGSDGVRFLPKVSIEPALEPLRESAAFCQRYMVNERTVDDCS